MTPPTPDQINAGMVIVGEALCVWRIAWDLRQCKREGKWWWHRPQLGRPDVTPEDHLERAHEAAVAAGDALGESMKGDQP